MVVPAVMETYSRTSAKHTKSTKYWIVKQCQKGKFFPPLVNFLFFLDSLVTLNIINERKKKQGLKFIAKIVIKL
jgi:hypothetical protein